MAIQAKMRIMAAGGKMGLGSTPMLTLPQKSSAAFVIGAPVKLSSGVLVAVSTTASVGTGSTLTQVKASSLNTILGFSAGKAASGATGDISVVPIMDGVLFKGSVIHGTAASAKVAATDIGATMYLAKQTSSDTHWGFTKDSGGSVSTDVEFTLVQLIDAASTLNGRVLVAPKTGGLLNTA